MTDLVVLVIQYVALMANLIIGMSQAAPVPPPVEEPVALVSTMPVDEEW